MDQTSISFEKILEKKENESSKFLKMFENSNKETEDEEEENSNDCLETFLPKDLFKENNNYEEEEKNEKEILFNRKKLNNDIG